MARIGPEPSRYRPRAGEFYPPFEFHNPSSVELQSHRYVEITPADDPIDPEAAIRAFQRLNALLGNRSSGLIARLRSSIERLEWLLVTDGREDSTFRQLVRASDDRIEDLVDVLRTALPDSYELRIVEWDHFQVIRHLPDPESLGEEPVDSAPIFAGVEYIAEVDRARDWQTPVRGINGRATPSVGQSDSDQSAGPIPLVGVIERLTRADVPTAFQVLTKPYRDWSTSADLYTKQLDAGTVSMISRMLEHISPRSSSQRRAHRPKDSDQRRIEAIRMRDQTRSFKTAVRAVAVAPPTENGANAVHRTAESLEDALDGFSGNHHRFLSRLRADTAPSILSHPRPGWDLFLDFANVKDASMKYDPFRKKIPFRANRSRGIILDTAELPMLCLADGARLSSDALRALGSRRTERTGLVLPPPDQLARYEPPGMSLIEPLTQDREPTGDEFVLPERLQDRHLVVVGDTGSGKSVLIETALLSNADATAGPEILFDTKGGGTSEEFLRMHYAKHGTLDDVVYFDLAETVPAFSFFDIGPLLDAGVPREEARSRIAAHYEEILAGLMGPEQYGEAAESVKAIRNHVRALFDPIHGAEAFAHEDLYATLLDTLRGLDTPPTSDDTLQRYFDGLDSRDPEVFTRILGGAVGRVENIATDGRLAPLFGHVPGDEDSPHFDFADILDDDVTVVFDLGGLATEVKRALTLVILSNLWRALTARTRRSRPSEERPLVNLYLEEASDVADTRLVDTLLSQGRGFGLSLTMGLQYVEQLATPDPERDTYLETLNETATFVVGNVSVDDRLPDVLATDRMDPDAVARRLASMARGEWLVRPGAGFREEPVEPFLGQSLPIPPGHPESDQPLDGDERRRFLHVLARAEWRTRRDNGVDVARLVDDDSETAGGGSSAAFDSPAADAESLGDSPSVNPNEPATPAADSNDADRVVSQDGVRTDTLLTHTQRMPPYVYYDEDADMLRCDRCKSEHDSDADGMVDAIECCYDLESVDSADIPICEIDLKLSREEIAASEWSVKQLLFLKAVHNAMTLQYDPPVYDLLFDSMNRLTEYVGISDDEVQELLEAGLLHRNDDWPHRLYSIYADGRAAVGEPNRHAVDFGHQVGDIRESSEHVLCVQLAVKLVRQEYRDDPESGVERVNPYHELRKGALPDAAYHEGDPDDDETSGYERRRLDVAGVDNEGNVVVAVEVERVHSSSVTEIPRDFDKLAAVDPAEAIWITMNRREGHEILETLYNPPDGEPRIDKRYQSNTPLQRVSIDEPGLTAIYSVVHIRDGILELDDERHLRQSP